MDIMDSVILDAKQRFTVLKKEDTINSGREDTGLLT